MDLTPKTVVITVPVNIPELRGRHSTTPPHGVVTSFRAPTSTMAAVDKAIALIDSTMSRGLFMRLVVDSAASAIISYVDEIRQQAEGLQNDDGNDDGTTHSERG